MAESTHVLVVCTANRCRSPLGEMMLKRLAHDMALPVLAASAGTQAVAGLPPTGGTEIAGKKLGVETSEILSRPLTSETVDWADLIITMEHQHVIDAVARFPQVFPRTFLISELAALVGSSDPSRFADLGEWLSAIGRDRTPSAFLANNSIKDVADPAGKSLRKHLRAGREVDDLLTVIFAGLEPLLQDSRVRGKTQEP